jgi:hypothetical protein
VCLTRRTPQGSEGLLHGSGGNTEQPRVGWLTSNIRKIALATANEPRARAAALIGLRPESTPKPQNSNIAQDTTIISSRHESGVQQNCANTTCASYKRDCLWKCEWE